ncbi:MAG: J domain-containing protein [Wolbachia endosymbiont of Fragariocoptes setiger]|nr:J domain-containing protein [Wolbachia endosymbiont of Fragariocoptes setiger]
MSFFLLIFLFMVVFSFILPSLFTFIFFIIGKNKINIDIISKFISELNKRKTNSNISQDEAFEILGLNQEANKNEINKAYYNLMKLVHPDKGGSAYFAQKLNEAREKLLNK